MRGQIFLTWVARVEQTELLGILEKKGPHVDWRARSASTGQRCQVTNGAPGQSSARNGHLINQRSACRLSPDCPHPEWQPSDRTLNGKPRRLESLCCCCAHPLRKHPIIFHPSVDYRRRNKVKIADLNMIKFLNVYCVLIILNVSRSLSRFLCSRFCD